MEKKNTENQPHVPKIPMYYQAPEYIDALSLPVNLMIVMAAKSSRMVLEERTRLHHPDGRSENVAEHSHMAAQVGYYLAKECYPHLDAGKVAIKLIIHDNVEAYVGDTATDRISEEERKQKTFREALGMIVLAQEHASLSPNYVNDMQEYEDHKSLEDEFSWAIDKITVLLVELAHGGESLRDYYSSEEYLALTYDTEKRMKKGAPNFPELADFRTELAHYLFEKYYGLPAPSRPTNA